ncbi:hypothetical protein DRQ50_07245, partial [bacterium]
MILSALVILASCSDIDDPRPTAPGVPDSDYDPDADGAYKDVDGDGLYHHVVDCEVCHDVFHAFDNLRFIMNTILTPTSGPKPVIFTARTGPNSFADGDGVYDGVCEICHTDTHYHRNTAAGDHSHYVSQDCVTCHIHKFEFAPVGGAGQSHGRHIGGGSGNNLDLACDYCHTQNPSVFQDGQPFASTTVCNECHSPDGVIDGVDDPAVGARTNWSDGVYDGDVLTAGKENWCSGCHDLGTSVIEGVTAPPVAGDATWGYSATGHGRSNTVDCLDCHDATTQHIDGVDNTYTAVLDNHQAGYRLSDVNGGSPMVIPRIDGNTWGPFADPPYYDLCFECHDKYALFGGPLAPAGPYYATEMRTNFRNDDPMIIPDGLGTDISHLTLTGVGAANSHATHMSGIPWTYDSDHDGAMDSRLTCVACHNVHGSTDPVMIRDGRFANHVTGLNFSHVRYDRHENRVPCGDTIIMTSDSVTREESHGGIMRSTTGQNGVCTFCHCSGGGTSEPEYMANCQGVACVDYYR